MIKTFRNYFNEHIAVTKSSQKGLSKERLRLATAALLVEMARADFKVEPEELEAVRQAIQSALKLTVEETDELITLADEEARDMSSYFQFTTVINKNCTLTEKITIIEFMWVVALADGRLDNYEEHFIRKIANLIHVPGREIVTAKHRAIKQQERNA